MEISYQRLENSGKTAETAEFRKTAGAHKNEEKSPAHSKKQSEIIQELEVALNALRTGKVLESITLTYTSN